MTFSFNKNILFKATSNSLIVIIWIGLRTLIFNYKCAINFNSKIYILIKIFSIEKYFFDAQYIIIEKYVSLQLFRGFL